jgi:BASS family bile acid:Na+ symporter
MAFMVGNLLSIGLELDLGQVLTPLRDVRFLVLVLAWDWLLCPGLAVLLVAVLPIAQPYAIGLLLIGMAPAAPFLPMVVRRADGDLAYAAAFMLVSAVGTVIFMPSALPLLAPGLAVDAWTVARPLVVLLLLPLAVGLAIRARFAGATRIARAVRLFAAATTFVLLAVVLIVYWRGFVEAAGSTALAAQLLFAVATTTGAWLTGIGLAPKPLRALSLGVCTRNLGAAFAPLLEVSADPRTTVMIALGVPVTLLASYFAALWFASRKG